MTHPEIENYNRMMKEGILKFPDNPWLKVEEVLPELHTTVLTFANNKIQMNHLVIKEKYKTIWNGCQPVKFWMHLPKPPEEKE